MVCAMRANRWVIVAFLAGLVIATTGTATAARFITGKDIKNGTVASKDIKNGTIKAKDLNKALRARLANSGVVGPVGPAGAQGPRGEVGPKGDPGPTLVSHTQNVESLWPISTSPMVAVTNYTLANYSGSYSAPLIHPQDATYVVVSVQARVSHLTGTNVHCTLQKRFGSSSWVDAATAAAPGYGDIFMNASFPSFEKGKSIELRVMCSTSSGSGTAAGEIGVVAAQL